MTATVRLPTRGSNQPFEVECSLRASPKCRLKWTLAFRVAERTRGRNGGRIVCLFCSRLSKFSGRKNPNAKYTSLDDGFFRCVDSEAKAYLLGWLASDGSLTEGSIALFIHKKDASTLERLRAAICPALPIRRRRDLVGFVINSKEIVRDVCRLLSIEPRKKSAMVRFPRLNSNELHWAFIRGYFDGDGSVVTPGTRTAPRCSIASDSAEMLTAIREFAGIPAHQMRGRLEWNGNSALDFLSRIYDGASICLQRKEDLYVDWSCWVPGLSGHGSHGAEVQFRWIKSLPEAVPPSKSRASDSGFDLTLVAKGKAHGPLQMYRTGIKIQASFGWYFDLVPRSSIVKTGYMLANSIGVIDRTYTGEILVPLYKVDPNAADLALPARLVQLVPRPIIHAEFVEVDSFDSTERGEGGFGSSDVIQKQEKAGTT